MNEVQIWITLTLFRGKQEENTSKSISKLKWENGIRTGIKGGKNQERVSW